MNCDLCGKEAELYRAIVEASELSVCQACSAYGRVVGKVAVAGQERPRRRQPVREEAIETVVPDLGQQLKKKREQMGMSQAEFARHIAVKLSTLHNYETGGLVPDLDTARHIGRKLGLHLIEALKEEPVHQQKTKSELTLGDLVKIRKRR
jgi:putative transcription factor